MSQFEERLRSLINETSQENASNTPDHILAQYLRRSLEVFNGAVQARESWYGRDQRPRGPQPVMETTIGAQPASPTPPGPSTFRPCTIEQHRRAVSTLSPHSPSSASERERAITDLLVHDQIQRDSLEQAERHLTATRAHLEAVESGQVASEELSAFREKVASLATIDDAYHAEQKKVEALTRELADLRDHARAIQDLPHILLVGPGWNYRAKIQTRQDVPTMGVLVVHVGESNPCEPLELELAQRGRHITYLQTVGSHQVEEIRALRRAIADAPADALRFRWLCEDHSEGEPRARRNLMLYRLQGMNYGTACEEIDRAMLSTITPTKEPG